MYIWIEETETLEEVAMPLSLAARSIFDVSLVFGRPAAYP